MKRFYLLSISFLIVGMVLVEIIKRDPGYILISLFGYTLESTFWVGLIILCVIGFVVWLGLRWTIRMLKGLGFSYKWILTGGTRAATRKTQKGLMYFMEGHWNLAKRELLSAAKK